jgi:hypothetical protein
MKGVGREFREIREEIGVSGVWATIEVSRPPFDLFFLMFIHLRIN